MAAPARAVGRAAPGDDESVCLEKQAILSDCPPVTPNHLVPPHAGSLWATTGLVIRKVGGSCWWPAAWLSLSVARHSLERSRLPVGTSSVGQVTDFRSATRPGLSRGSLNCASWEDRDERPLNTRMDRQGSPFLDIPAIAPPSPSPRHGVREPQKLQQTRHLHGKRLG